jgi:hypothetical protein
VKKKKKDMVRSAFSIPRVCSQVFPRKCPDGHAREILGCALLASLGSLEGKGGGNSPYPSQAQYGTNNQFVEMGDVYRSLICHCVSAGDHANQPISQSAHCNKNGCPDARRQKLTVMATVVPVNATMLTNAAVFCRAPKKSGDQARLRASWA